MNGTIAPSTPQQKFAGQTTQFAVTPDMGYSAVMGGTCGGTLTAGVFTTNVLTADCSVIATFTAVPTYTVTPTANTGGTISPATPQSVQSGNTAVFTVTPSTGYTVSVGGTCGGNLVGTTYTTNAIVADCTVDATFTIISYTVTPSAGANGSISPTMAQTVNHGSSTVFTVTPDSGYAAVVGGTCGGTLTGTTYTTAAITASCTVDATFNLLPVYTVTATASAHGTITPSMQSVISGNTTTFTVTPDAGYFVAMRGTCGGALSGTTYTTNAVTADCSVTATFAKKIVLFLGNSYTFGRVDPVMSYNTANVTDLTLAMWLQNSTGSNIDEPHPWGGIPGVFKKMADQAGLEYDVSISARNAASLRGHYLNSNPAGWDLRGNAASQKWNAIVLQDLSDEPLPAGRSPNANLPYFNAYADKFEAWVHVGSAETFTETALFGGGDANTCATVTGASVSACNTVRTISPANANASAATDVYLYQTWARPDLIAPNGTNAGGATYTQMEGLEAMTADFHNAYFGRAGANANYKAVNPVGDAFLRAVTSGVAMRDPYVPEAGKINLWHTDNFHPSKYGSYLSALVHFAMISGLDPLSLGMGELAAADLGISTADALALQQVAHDTVVPAAPTIGIATGGNGQVTIAFTPASAVGTLPVTGFTATCGAQTASGAGSPLVVTGLANGTPVTCTVRATNSVGQGAASAASNSATPSIAVTITSGAAPSSGTVGVAYSHTVIASGSPAPTFSVSSGALPTGLTLNTSSGLISGTPTAAGPFTGTIQAGNGVSSDSQSFSITIAQAAQSITFNALPGKLLGDPPFTVSASATSGLAVAFTSQTPGVCSATGTNGSTITLLAAGNCTIAANQAGDANFLAATQVVRSFGVASSSQCVSLSSPGVAYTQDFDTLSNSTNSSTLPTGWKLFETGTGADTTYGVGNGSSTSGNTYSFGATSSTDRAFGTLQSGSVIPTIGACFTNDTGTTLASLAIAYVGEEWRLGATGRADRLDFQYSLDATSVSSTSTWIDVNALDFSTPNTTGAVGALDGNATGNKTPLSATIGSLSIPPGATFWIRWTDFNPSGSDDGLAIDDFSLTPTALVIQPDLTVADVAQTEGNAGTTTFTFTVNLSAPAGMGGVTFDIATANGTATAGVDYVAKTLTSQTIPAGMTSYTFTVDVNGDTTTEPDETFFVNVTNLTGANLTRGQAVGTILNDDAGVSLSINNVTQVEGNSGTSLFAFTVTLSGPAPMGGVTFDVATSNGTATAGVDYVAQTLTNQVIPEGSTSYTLNVVVNGDTDVEPDETFFVTLSNVSGATAPNTQAKGTILTDDIQRIHTVQGSGTASPFVGQAVTVEGIVTQISQGANSLNGYFIQEPDNLADSDPLTSEGIFVFTNATPASVNLGDLVRVTGTVSEFGTAPNTLTEIGTPTLTPTTTVVSTGNPLPSFTIVTLPVANLGDLERYEGMRVRFNQTLTVSDHFDLAHFGEITVKANGLALQATQVVDPNDNPASGNSSTGSGNVAAVTAYENLNQRSSVLIDGSGGVYPATVPFLDPMTNTIRLGSTLSDLTGVLSQLAGTHRVYPDVAPVFTYAQRPMTPPSVGGTVKVASANVLNYFNGNGAGGGFPTSRGADTLAEFNRQRAKVIAAISGLGADVVGILEMENDGTGPASAVQDLVSGLNAVDGAGTWNVIADPVQYNGTNPGTTDLIRPTIIYKPAVVTPSGASLALIDSVFNSARAPVAQTFTHNTSGEKFTLVVNHFKSKGSGGTGADADLGDGQGFYNDSRKQQAQALVGFINTLAATTPRVIAMGDFNAYAEEDPLDVLRAAGLVSLTGADNSYMFGGRSGSLDHAFANPALNAVVSGAGHWHINADEPVLLDYNVENKNTMGCTTLPCTTPDYFTGSPFRASDHDPVLVGLQLVSLCFAGTYSATGNAPCTPASPGSFVPNAGATMQTACLAGTYQPNGGATACLQADPGSFVSGSGATTQVACTAGSYSSVAASVMCTQATPGNFVPNQGATEQTACLAGTYQPNGSATSCLQADPGSYVSGTGASMQVACTAGSYQPNAASTACLLASPGFFVSVSGATMQTQCAMGTTSLVMGATSCVPIFTVTPSAGSNGSISPSMPVSVVQGQSTSFTVTPNAGYSVSMGGSCTGTLMGSTYQVDPVTADCSVIATFNFIPVIPDAPTISVSAGDGQVTVRITGGFDGGSPITAYATTCGAVTVTNASTTQVVTPLANFVPVTCSTVAINAVGTSAASAGVMVTPVPALAVTAISSRKVHAAAGPFDLPITRVSLTSTDPGSGAGTVEPRAEATHAIVFKFNQPVQDAGIATLNGNAIAAGQVTITGANSDEVTITLIGVADQTEQVIALSGTNQAFAGASAKVGFLVGDVNGSRAVADADVSVVKARAGAVAEETTFRYDINLSGQIGAADIAAVKSRLSRALP